LFDFLFPAAGNHHPTALNPQQRRKIMILTLKTDKGEVVAEWEIERDFGNIDHCIPASTMVSDIRSAYRRNKPPIVNEGDMQEYVAIFKDASRIEFEANGAIAAMEYAEYRGKLSGSCVDIVKRKAGGENECSF
jgi:hypothetical protein